MNGVGLHKLQCRIAFRGAQLTAVGGRLVYSTCSFNPVENEAVVATLLEKCLGALRLVDVSSKLPLLKRKPGLKMWTICNKKGELVADAQAGGDQFAKTCFPRSAEESDKMHLERCLRLYPHMQDTGGFFVAVFEKIEEIGAAGIAEAKARREASLAAKSAATSEADSETVKCDNQPTVSEPAVPNLEDVIEDGEEQDRKRGFKEDPFIFQDEKGEGDWWPEVKEFYGFLDSWPENQLFTRNSGPGKKRNVYFASKLIRDLLTINDPDKLRIINCGTKVLTRSDAKDAPCDLRLCMDGINTFFPFIDSTKRVICCTLADLTAALSGDGVALKDLSEKTRSRLAEVTPGCTVLSYTPGPDDELSCPLQATVWQSKQHFRPLVSKDDRRFMLMLILGPAYVDSIVPPKPAQPAPKLDHAAKVDFEASTSETALAAEADVSARKVDSTNPDHVEEETVRAEENAATE